MTEKRRRSPENQTRKAVARLIRLFVIAPIALAASFSSAAAQNWSVAPDFDNTTNAAENISGGVCPAGPTGLCYAVNDENKFLQTFRINGRKITPGALIRLLPETIDGEDLDEADIEGAAYSIGFVYVTGSHSVSKRKGKVQPSRNFMFRFPVNQADGTPKFQAQAGVVDPKIERSDRLDVLLKQGGPLSNSFGRRLQGNGLNIEGLAVLDGMAVFGLRQPVFAKSLAIATLPMTCLFGPDKPCAPVVHLLPVGTKGTGVRDLVAVENGLLILSGGGGPEETRKPAIWYWSGGSNPPSKLLRWKTRKKNKAEGLLLLAPYTPGGSNRALILHDGPMNAKPKEVTF